MTKFILLMLFSAQLLASTIELTWSKPELREDGTAIESIDRYNIRHTFNNGGQNIIEIDPTLSSYQVLDADEGIHTFQINAVEYGVEGELSDVVSVSVERSKPVRILLQVQVID